MTLWSPFVVDPGLIARASERPARSRDRSVRNGALITTACVAGGFALAMTTLPPVPSPTGVAQAYIEAGFHEDWQAAWDLLCSPTRDALGDVHDFAEGSAYLNAYWMLPSEVDVEVEDVHAIRGPAGPVWEVAISTTSDERNREDWQQPFEVPVVLEDGAFRVCSLPVSPA